MNYASRNLITRGWDARIAHIGPKEALAILEKANRDNRPIRQKAVEKYARIMRDGDWRLTPEPIVISDTGRLLNGQHRLSAVIKAERSHQFLVIQGVDEDVFPSIDRGVGRTTADALGMDKKTIEAARVLAERMSGQGSWNPHDAVVGRVAEVIQETHDQIAGYSKSPAKVFSSAPFRAAAVLRIMGGLSPEYVRETYKALVNGELVGLGAAPLSIVAAVARNALSAKGSVNVTEVFIKAWDALDEEKRDNTRILIKDTGTRLTEIRKVFDRVMAAPAAPPVRLAA